MGRLVFVLWLFPLLEGGLMVIGLTKARFGRAHRGGSGATQAIIQITTIGNFDTVTEIIAAVADYELPFPYEFWVVIDEGVENRYAGADRVVVVPSGFECEARYKARAQEYSRRVRQAEGLDRHDVKIVMLDDDSLPTQKYLIDVVEADFDVCEGILAPRRGYGRLMTHLDDLRTLNCLIVCSFWQGIGHPVWVHGEGLCLRGSAEAVVTWNYPVIASEDLTVGHNAVELGLSWGFVWEYVQLTSPWTFSDFITQRRRWIWGNVYAIRNGLIPPLGAAVTAARWIIGAVVEVLVTAALFLVPLKVWHPPTNFLAVLLVSLVVWLLTFGWSCWVGSEDEGASTWDRIANTAIGIVLAPISSFLTTFVLLYGLAKGDPRRFEVIAKSRQVELA